MLAIWLVCAAPVIASYFTFYVIKPSATTSYGDIINPAKMIPQLSAMTLDMKPVELPDLKRQWLLISVAGGECNAVCERWFESFFDFGAIVHNPYPVQSVFVFA